MIRSVRVMYVRARTYIRRRSTPPVVVSFHARTLTRVITDDRIRSIIIRRRCMYRLHSGRCFFRRELGPTGGCALSQGIRRVLLGISAFLAYRVI